MAGVKFLYLAAKMKICKKNYKITPRRTKIYQNIPPSDENNDFESNVDDPFVAKGVWFLQIMNIQVGYMLEKFFLLRSMLALRKIQNLILT